VDFVPPVAGLTVLLPPVADFVLIWPPVAAPPVAPPLPPVPTAPPVELLPPRSAWNVPPVGDPPLELGEPPTPGLLGALLPELEHATTTAAQKKIDLFILDTLKSTSRIGFQIVTSRIAGFKEELVAVTDALLRTLVTAKRLKNY
jgi:hypothetical protein